MSIVQNLKNIQQELEINKVNPKIIAVSKTFPIKHINPLLDHGHLIYGENRVQEAKDKWEDLIKVNSNLELHLIGGLQTNKSKDAVKLFNYIHSVDRTSLIDELFKAENKLNLKRKYFIQVNTGDEDQKFGVSVKELSNLFDYAKSKINVIGLMCIPPVNEKAEVHFKTLKSLAEDLSLNELSMGMSHDYIDASKIGATYIRVGSKIFGSRG